MRNWPPSDRFKWEWEEPTVPPIAPLPRSDREGGYGGNRRFLPAGGLFEYHLAIGIIRISQSDNLINQTHVAW